MKTHSKFDKVVGIYKEYTDYERNEIPFKLDALTSLISSGDTLDDIISFVGVINKMNPKDSKSFINETLMHDLRGLMSGDEFFIPRVEGYRTYYTPPKEIKDEV